MPVWPLVQVCRSLWWVLWHHFHWLGVFLLFFFLFEGSQLIFYTRMIPHSSNCECLPLQYSISIHFFKNLFFYPNSPYIFPGLFPANYIQWYACHIWWPDSSESHLGFLLIFSIVNVKLWQQPECWKSRMGCWSIWKLGDISWCRTMKLQSDWGWWCLEIKGKDEDQSA